MAFSFGASGAKPNEGSNPPTTSAGSGFSFLSNTNTQTADSTGNKLPAFGSSSAANTPSGGASAFGSGGLFGNTNQTTAKPASSIFGNTGGTPSQPSGQSSFGKTGFSFGTPAAGNNSPNALGSSSTNTPSGISTAGNENKPTGGFSLFGGAASNVGGAVSSSGAQSSAPSTAGPQPTTSNATTPNPQPGFHSFFNAGKGTSQASSPGGWSFKPVTSSSAAPQSTTPATSFGSNPPSGQTQATPASSKPTVSFGTSTTPANAPPATSTGASGPISAGGNLFGNKPLFGSSSGASPAPTTSAAAPANSGAPSSQSPFSIFGNSAKPQAGQPQVTSSGTTASTTSQQTPAAGAGAGLFGLNKQPQSSTPSGANLFGTGAGTPPASTQPSKPLFPTATSAPPASSSQPSQSLFPSSSAAAAPSTSSQTSQPAASTAASASSFAGMFAQSSAPSASNASVSAQPAPSAATTSASSSGPATTTATTSATGAAGLAASTAGPAPTAQSRLKNKSMDDIITRWANDLSKYQKEFQNQANTVAVWDRLLVENSEKISKLYSKTFQAERDATEVERQLVHVEGQQEELAQWLDRYETEVDALINRQNAGMEGLQGPDQERETTYKLAEKLSDRMNGLNKDLTDMIDEINGVSAQLSKTKSDDPLSQVVRVLNSHLSQLQQIDMGASNLQRKIEAAQKEGQRISANGYGSVGGDHADDFMRSFMRR